MDLIDRPVTVTVAAEKREALAAAILQLRTDLDRLRSAVPSSFPPELGTTLVARAAALKHLQSLYDDIVAAAFEVPHRAPPRCVPSSASYSPA